MRENTCTEPLLKRKKKEGQSDCLRTYMSVTEEMYSDFTKNEI